MLFILKNAVTFVKNRATAFWKDQAFSSVICVTKMLCWWGLWACTDEMDKTWAESTQQILPYCYVAIGYSCCTICFLFQFASARFLGEPTSPQSWQANLWLSILAILSGISSLVTWKGIPPQFFHNFSICY